MPISQNQLALKIIEVVALLLPFVGIIYSAFVPDSGRIKGDPEGWESYIFDPRYQLKGIVVVLIVTAGLALGPIWASLQITNFLKLSVLSLIISLGAIAVLVDNLVRLRVEMTEESDEK